MNVMKYFLTILGALCAWLFVVIIIDFNDLLDLPLFVYMVVLVFMMVGAHILGTKKYGNPGPEDASSRIMVKLFIIGFLSLVGTIVAALAVTAAVNPDYRAELSAPFVTCNRDDSEITTVSVNKELAVNGGKITVHSIITNVPQSAKNPQPYSYECQKATLAEISVVSEASSNDVLGIRDLELVTTSEPRGVSADELNSGSQFTSFATSKKLDALRQSRLDESRNERGWVSFSLSESDNGEALRLVFDKYGQNKSVELK